MPLTLGNAIIAITEENNQLFPDRPVSERGIAIRPGHEFGQRGAGRHPDVSRRRRHGGTRALRCAHRRSPIILGVSCFLLSLLFSGSVATLLRMFPPAVLGVILFLTGAQLALGSCDISKDKGERFATVVTAGLATWNVGIAFVVGSAVYLLARRGSLKL